MKKALRWLLCRVGLHARPIPVPEGIGVAVGVRTGTVRRLVMCKDCGRVRLGKIIPEPGWWAPRFPDERH